MIVRLVLDALWTSLKCLLCLSLGLSESCKHQASELYFQSVCFENDLSSFFCFPVICRKWKCSCVCILYSIFNDPVICFRERKMQRKAKRLACANHVFVINLLWNIQTTKQIQKNTMMSNLNGNTKWIIVFIYLFVYLFTFILESWLDIDGDPCHFSKT